MKLIEDLDGLIAGKINSIKALVKLIKLESKLAGLTVFPLVLNICMLFVILITLWSLIMLFLGYFIYVESHNYWLSLLGTFLLNILILVGLVKYLTFNLKAMSFERTRRYFDYEPIEKSSIDSNH